MPIPSRDADLAFALQDSGVAVTLGGSSTFGLVRKRGIEDADERGFSRVTDFTVVVTIKTGSLPGIKSGSHITAGGVAYVVKAAPAEDDGKVTRIACVER